MIALVRVVVVALIIFDAAIADEEKHPKIVIVGAGASGIATAAKLLENGYNNVVILEAQNRIGGRVNSVPFGKGYVDLGAQWCEGENGNVVYELVKNYFVFGDTAVRFDNCHCYDSKGELVDPNKCSKLLELSFAITYDLKSMAKYNGSLGEFFEINYQKGLQDKKFDDVDKELADQIMDVSERLMNSLYASETWFDVSATLNANNGAEGNQQLTWKEHGYRIVLDFLMKKLPDPTKALNFENKIHFNQEVTNIDWTSNEAVVKCADGSEYRADHVIATVSLGYLKKNHLTLFTPHLPEKKINAIENTGFGTLGKIFLEFEKPFWSTDIDDWAGYLFLWKQEDKDNIIGTEKEWLLDVTDFIREDAQPNLLGGHVAGKRLKQFEEISDSQLIDDCMWLFEKFLGKTLPRPINMRRSRWLTNKYFLGSYSFASMETQAQNVTVTKDLAEALSNEDGKPILLISGEATDEINFGYVHGAVASGWRAADEILDYYRSIQH